MTRVVGFQNIMLQRSKAVRDPLNVMFPRNKRNFVCVVS